MAKHSFEFKLMVIKEYLSGKAGYNTLAKEHGIGSGQLKRWVANYRHFGEESLARSRQQKTYSFEFKLSVVELYLTSELSYQEVALQTGVTNSCLIAGWVSAYRSTGPEALKPRKKGRARKMDKERIVHEIEDGDSDEQKELLKQLQDENLKLRIENAFLKESRRLRLEEEHLLNEMRESSTVSEENSN